MRLVLKFGGTSLGTIEKIRAAAKLVSKEIAAGNQVAIVASAMSGETNRLVALCNHFAWGESLASQFEYDSIVSSAENISSGLLALSLMEIGHKARSLQGWQVPVYTSLEPSVAQILHVDTEVLEAEWQTGTTPIVTGFQGVSFAAGWRTTTLGRGGSDTSAVALAAALKADRCDIYTDVDGVYSYNPNELKDAVRLDHVSYEAMIELAGAGAKVLHSRSVEIAYKHSMPVKVLSSFASSGGTMVEDRLEGSRVFGIAKNPQPLFLVPIEELAADRAFILLWQNDQAIVTYSNLHDSQGEQLIGYTEVSVAGVGLRSDAVFTHKLYLLLKQYRTLFISSSDTKISIVIEEKYVAQLVENLHNTFISNEN